MKSKIDGLNVPLSQNISYESRSIYTSVTVVYNTTDLVSFDFILNAHIIDSNKTVGLSFGNVSVSSGFSETRDVSLPVGDSKYVDYLTISVSNLNPDPIPSGKFYNFFFYDFTGIFQNSSLTINTGYSWDGRIDLDSSQFDPTNNDILISVDIT